MTVDYCLNQPWVFLKRFPSSNLKPYHIEPLSRYQEGPPLSCWKLVGVYGCYRQAYEAMREDFIGQRYAKRHSTHVSYRRRFLVLRRDKYRCQFCGRTARDGVQLEVDHKVPKSKGGNNELSNLWTLCLPCNRGKSNLDLLA